MIINSLFNRNLSGVLESLIMVLESLLMVVPLLRTIAYLTLVERKILAAIQRRRGPNVIGLYGVGTPLADGLKLFLKESIIPHDSDVGMFLISPIGTFTLAIGAWGVMPFGEQIVLGNINLGVIYRRAVSSLSVYGIIVGGWSSNSKYALLGALRSAAQIVSYEVSIGLIICSVIVCAGSMNLTDIVVAQQDVWYMFPLLPMSIMFFVSVRAETNRHPFDMPEAEAELVSGYNVEYSAMGFALYFLGEMGNVIRMSTICALLFIGGWYAPFGITLYLPSSVWLSIKTMFFLARFVWARAAYPRYRYDQRMRLGWKVFLPLARGYLMMVSGVLLGFNGLM
jgi:NADH-quinone oxidoreductase subunit H